uniref:Large polyvalent protein associated domain-containing protein n=1 Tax=viral metagenome TaxID=1070528 RepID=A0A6M3KKB7_9ZZZZ
MVTQRIDYKAELEKLQPEEREQYTGKWRTYLQGLPRGTYIQQLTNLTRQFGPEFSSQLIQPELVMDKMEPAPITKVPALEIKPEESWYQKPLEWIKEQPVVKAVGKGVEKYYGGWITPAAMTIAQPLSAGLREQLGGRKPFAIPQEERGKIWEESNLPWLTKIGTELLVDPAMYFGWGLAPKAVGALERAGLTGLAKAIKPMATAEEAYIRASQVPIKAAGKALHKLPAIIPDIPELRATGKLVFRKPLEESVRSIVRNLPTHAGDMLDNLGVAGEQVGKPFSQILQDFAMGTPDEALLKTITSPQQKRALDFINRNVSKLGLDELVPISNSYPEVTAAILGQRLARVAATELGVMPPRIAPGVLGATQRILEKSYSLWKRTVLQTPFYVTQNLAENQVRQVMVGVTPIFDIMDIAKLPDFKGFPIDIQRKVISLLDRWNKTIPERASALFARTASTGGVTEAVTGSIAMGKGMPASTVAAYLDDMAIANTFTKKYYRIKEELMRNGSVEVKAALDKISGLYDFSPRFNVLASDAAKDAWVLDRNRIARLYLSDIEGKVDQQLLRETSEDFVRKLEYSAPKFPEVAPILNEESFQNLRALVDSGQSIKMMDFDAVVADLHGLPVVDQIEKRQRDFLVEGGWSTWDALFTGKENVIRSWIVLDDKLVEHLRQISISGTTDDVVHAFQQVQRNKTMTIARAMNKLEESLPGAIRDKIKVDLPRLWAKNDIVGINKMFGELTRTLPQRIETYQKQLMIQRLRSYRDVLRSQVPKQYQSYLTKILNRFKYERVGEAEAKIANAKSLTEFERAMFQAHVASRRELETLAEWTMLTEAMAKNVPPETLATWFVISDEINRVAFAAGDKFAEKTFEISNVVRFAKDPAKTQSAWDNYIMEIQSLAPDLADTMRATTPNNDMLWHTYRGVQEQRWFNVGQDKLKATGIDLNKLPKAIDANGKIITQEDFLHSQVSALKSWEDRVIGAWDKRHAVPGKIELDAYNVAMDKYAKAKTAYDTELVKYGKAVVVHGKELEAAEKVAQETDELVSQVLDKWSKAKVRNSKLAKKDLDALKAKGVEVGDAEDALNEYKDTIRSDFGDAEEFADARSDTWDEFVNQLGSIDAADIVEPTALAPKPIAPVVPVKPKISDTAAKDKLLDNLRAETINAKESIALQEQRIQNQAKDMALDSTYATFGNYATRTNLDEFMQGIGAPFWFFPSRSIPFYATQMIQKPRLGIEVINLQKSEAESNQPSRVFGDIPIPGTNYWYNPLRSTMLWQLADRQQFTPAALGEVQSGMNWMRNNLAISLGPQWQIAATLVERVMAKQQGEFAVGTEPQPIIPQQRWLEAIAGLKLPVISTAAGLLNEPFDMYLRAVYGDSVANWSQREVEKQIVDMGYNPQTAPKEVIQDAWKRYYTRQLLSIPGGAVKELTPTELARFEAINEKAKEMGLTKEQRVTLRELGESPFVGLRQDQIEAIYKDVPAQKLWRYIRPSSLTAKSKPIWNDYIQLKLGRETLLYGADKDNPTKGSRLYNEFQYDKALQSGRISPREWKSLYRQSYANYLSQVQQLETDYKLAPKTDQDWEVYRELLGWDEPVRHPDDIKLDEYYDAMDSSNFENDLGEFDYDAYRKAEQQFFSGLSPDTVAYIQSRKDRYKSPLRATYSRDMKKVQPYYDLQDAILAQYPPQTAALIEYALTVPDSAIQRAVMVGNPQAVIAMRRIRLAKDQLRRKNPEMDRILRYWSS